MKLADVSPKLFAMYRTGLMNMDQLMALSLADTHQKQEDAWESLPVYGRQAHAIRSVILGDGVRSSLVRFVGLEAYELAGGHVIRDLFSDEQGESAHIGDPELLHRLATERLNDLAEAERATGGWSWVEVAFDYGYEVRERYCAAPTARREPSAEEAHALGELERSLDDANAQLEALYDADGDDDVDGDGEDGDADNRESIDALEEQTQALQLQIDGIESNLAYCSPEVMALAGALLTLSNDGAVVVKRNLMHKADQRAVARSGGKDHGEGGADGTEGVVAASKGLSAALCKELTAYKTEALQVAMVRKPQVALAALAHAMATMLLYEGAMSRYHAPTALGVSVQSCNWSLLQSTPALADSSAHKSLYAVVDAWRRRLPAEPADLMAYLLEQSSETLGELLALCAALTASAVHGTAHVKPAAALAGAASLDMADWWEADGDHYLGRVSKSLIAQALVEAGEGEASGQIASLKKADAVSKAQSLLAGKRWLPKLLRATA